MRLVKIDWEDSASPMNNDWLLADEVKDNSLPCHSVGYIIKENKNQVVLAAHYYNDDDGNFRRGTGWMCIPKSAIRKIEDIVPAKKHK